MILRRRKDESAEILYDFTIIQVILDVR